MSVQDLGALGELLAVLATIATLVYLSLQIRKNTRMAKTQYSATTVTALQPFQLWRAEDAEKAKYIAKE